MHKTNRIRHISLIQKAKKNQTELALHSQMVCFSCIFFSEKHVSHKRTKGNFLLNRQTIELKQKKQRQEVTKL